jgi:uncharacterized CHY-type Zn-finger protein
MLSGLSGPRSTAARPKTTSMRFNCDKVRLTMSWADDDLEDHEFPDEDADDDSSETVTCSNCGNDVYEDAVKCPICGEYISSNTSPLNGRSWWWIALGLVGIAAVILAILGPGF